MKIDEQELRRLVFIAQCRRMRSLAFHIPTVEDRLTGIDSIHDLEEMTFEALLSEIEAFARLLDYLEDCLDMRSEFRHG